MPSLSTDNGFGHPSKQARLGLKFHLDLLKVFFQVLGKEGRPRDAALLLGVKGARSVDLAPPSRGLIPQGTQGAFLD